MQTQTTRARTPRSPRRASILVAALGAAACISLPGCQSDLFPDDAPRSPYARYDALRRGEPPVNERDTFNKERPALRARLAPRTR